MRFLFIVILIICVAQLHAQQQLFQCHSSRVAYTVYGCCDPVVFINDGPGMSSEGSSVIAKALAITNQVVVYDQRGTGNSTLTAMDSTTVTVDKLVEDLECLREHLGFPRWTLMGHGFGCVIASRYAARYSDKTSAIILSSVVNYDAEGLADINKNALQNLLPEERDSLRLLEEQIFLRRRFNSITLTYRLARIMAKAYVVQREHTYIVADRLMQRNDRLRDLLLRDVQKNKINIGAGLSNFGKPVLIIEGDRDVVDRHTADNLHRALRQSTLILLERCGHYGWLDAPSSFFKSIREFLKAR